jgi:hypothetical protein
LIDDHAVRILRTVSSLVGLKHFVNDRVDRELKPASAALSIRDPLELGPEPPPYMA